jgi:hypothetical protein
LEKNQLLPARVLLISDGQPNCQGNGYIAKHLCRILDATNKNSIQFKLDIIGYKASTKDAEFKECAKQHPEAVRYPDPANNPNELEITINKLLPQKSDDKWWVPLLASLIGLLGVYWRIRSGKQPSYKDLGVRVLDDKTSALIAEAEVTLAAIGAPMVRYTDGKGIYIFVHDDIKNPPKSITIHIKAKGYEKTSRQITPSGNKGIEEFRLIQKNDFVE